MTVPCSRAHPYAERQARRGSRVRMTRWNRRGYPRLTHGVQCSLLVACMALFGCERPAQEGATPARSGNDTPPPALASSAPDTMPLTMDALPLATREALDRYAPGFVPFADSLYPRAVVAEARRFGFHGLMVIRADLQGAGRVDYAVAGMEGSNARVIALFRQADDTYRAVPVTTFDATELGSSPPRVLQLMGEPCSGLCAPVTISVIPLSGSATRGNEGWIWSPERNHFWKQEFPD